MIEETEEPERIPVPACAMMGPPGWRCACRTEFSDYYALAEHIRLTIRCPQCQAAPSVTLGEGELYRWSCGHWMAKGDLTAALLSASEKELP